MRAVDHAAVVSRADGKLRGAMATLAWPCGFELRPAHDERAHVERGRGRARRRDARPSLALQASGGLAIRTSKGAVHHPGWRGTGSLSWPCGLELRQAHDERGHGIQGDPCAKRKPPARRGANRRSCEDRLRLAGPGSSSLDWRPSPRTSSLCLEITSPSRFRIGDQYMSWPPPCPPAAFFSSLGFSAMRASLVSSRVATLAAFCRAVRVTLVGSITPALTRSS